MVNNCAVQHIDYTLQPIGTIRMRSNGTVKLILLLYCQNRWNKNLYFKYWYGTDRCQPAELYLTSTSTHAQRETVSLVLYTTKRLAYAFANITPLQSLHIFRSNHPTHGLAWIAGHVPFFRRVTSVRPFHRFVKGARMRVSQYQTSITLNFLLLLGKVTSERSQEIVL